ncbi:MAG: phosphate regulon transcriptional regulator PhoB [Pseudomonadota bacterium]|jgi:two-component system phosphate regulon response regulator PhoB
MFLPNVLIIEDDYNIAEILYINLSSAGLNCIKAVDVQHARSSLSDNIIHLIILDWMLPKQSGISFLKELKSNTSTKDIPVLMLTARQSEDDTIAGLDAGADDYIYKPFSPKQVVARVKSVIRRIGLEQLYSINNIYLNNQNKQVYLQYSDTSIQIFIDLSPTEFKLLSFLMQHPDRVYSRAELLNHVWHDIGDIDERTVDVQIKRLRQAINLVDKTGICANSIETVRGFGYKIKKII